MFCYKSHNLCIFPINDFFPPFFWLLNNGIWPFTTLYNLEPLFQVFLNKIRMQLSRIIVYFLFKFIYYADIRNFYYFVQIINVITLLPSHVHFLSSHVHFLREYLLPYHVHCLSSFHFIPF